MVFNFRQQLADEATPIVVQVDDPIPEAAEEGAGKTHIVDQDVGKATVATQTWDQAEAEWKNLLNIKDFCKS